MIRAAALAWLLPLPLSFVQAAPPFILDEDTVEVTTSFRGTDLELMTYLTDPDPEAQMVVVGPPATLTFRQKARRAGLWVNTGKQVLEGAAAYVALVGFDVADLEAACTAQNLAVLGPQNAPDMGWACTSWQRDLMAAKGLFVLSPRAGVKPLGQGFHQAQAFLPPTAKPGAYGLKVWVNGEGAETQISVRRAGLERLILVTAQEQRLLYGVLCLVLAALAGYLTNLISSRRD